MFILESAATDGVLPNGYLSPGIPPDRDQQLSLSQMINRESKVGLGLAMIVFGSDHAIRYRREAESGVDILCRSRRL